MSNAGNPNSRGEFTEHAYRQLLTIAKLNYQFISFPEYLSQGRTILWRHDVDFSLHRALRLAEIEKEEGVFSTFFIHLHSDYYNALDPVSLELIKAIVELGHDIALHFDPEYYKNIIKNKKDFLKFLDWERKIIEDLFCVQVNTFSFHNPNIGEWLKEDADEIGGLINAYGAGFKKQFGYCSDSNGYWRFDFLKDVLESACHEKLQVLTHPVWWVPSQIAPRERIMRSILGRADSSLQNYDQLLDYLGRENIRGSSSALIFLKDIDPKRFNSCEHLWFKGELDILFVVLWHLHLSQINNICRARLSKDWHVPEHEMNSFFERTQGGGGGDNWYLFQAVFGRVWQDMTDTCQHASNDWRKVYNHLACGVKIYSDDKLNEGCLWLSKMIHKVKSWGEQESGLKYDGLSNVTPLIPPPWNSYEDECNHEKEMKRDYSIESFFSKMQWEKFVQQVMRREAS